MLLKDLLYVDHSINSLSFEEGDYMPEIGGSVSYTVSRKDNAKILGVDKKKKDVLHLIDYVTLEISAKNALKGNEESVAFELKSKIEILYQAPKTARKSLTSKFFDDNEWYFSNYAHHVAHKVTAYILEDTKFRGVVYQIPKHRMDPKKD